MTPLQAFLLGIMVAYTPALLVWLWVLSTKTADHPSDREMA